MIYLGGYRSDIEAKCALPIREIFGKNKTPSNYVILKVLKTLALVQALQLSVNSYRSMSYDRSTPFYKSSFS